MHQTWQTQSFLAKTYPSLKQWTTEKQHKRFHLFCYVCQGTTCYQLPVSFLGNAKFSKVVGRNLNGRNVLTDIRGKWLLLKALPLVWPALDNSSKYPSVYGESTYQLSNFDFFFFFFFFWNLRTPAFKGRGYVVLILIGKKVDWVSFGKTLFNCRQNIWSRWSDILPANHIQFTFRAVQANDESNIHDDNLSPFSYLSYRVQEQGI